MPMELLLLGMFCCAGGFGIIALGLVVWVVMQQRRPLAPQEIAQAETTAEAYFAATMATLPTWNSGALSDLACRWEGAKTGLTRGQHQGRVMSVRQPSAAWLAFYLTIKSAEGFVRLRASDREVRLEVVGANWRVTVDQSPFGSLRENEGSLFEARGQAIGHYQRYRGARMWMGSRSLSARYGAVELHGRTIAEVNDALNWGGGLFNAGDARRQLVRVKIESLTTEEENWLLALVAVELYYNALRTAAAIN
jgi:hypothetical protein